MCSCKLFIDLRPISVSTINKNKFNPIIPYYTSNRVIVFLLIFMAITRPRWPACPPRTLQLIKLICKDGTTDLMTRKKKDQEV